MAVEVHRWREVLKNTLIGFGTFRMTNIALEIRDCPVHQKNGERWLQMPSRPYQDQEGNQKYAYIIKFYEKDRWHQFQASALAALDRYLEQEQETGTDDGVPF